MKSSIRTSLMIALLTLPLLVLSGCSAYVPSVNSGGLVVGQSYHLPSGDTLNDDLTVIGGDARIDQGSTINGDVAVIGGSVNIDGQVNGNVSILGGTTRLGDNAHITGDVNALGGTVNKAAHAVIEGKQTSGSAKPIVPPAIMRTPPMNITFDPIGAPLMAIFQGLAMAALAVLITLFAPRQLERTGQTVTSTPFASVGVGCLTMVILTIMAITIILLPVSVLAFLVAVVAGLFGWAALGLMTGRQIAAWTHQPWSDPVNAGVGTLAISLLASLLNMLWCIGFPIYAITGLVVLGAAVLTRFGTQSYPTGYSYSPAPRPASPYASAAPQIVDQPAQPERGASIYDAPANPPTGTDQQNSS